MFTCGVHHCRIRFPFKRLRIHLFDKPCQDQSIRNRLKELGSRTSSCTPPHNSLVIFAVGIIGCKHNRCNAYIIQSHIIQNTRNGISVDPWRARNKQNDLSVPRPSLILVASSKQSPGYKSILSKLCIAGEVGTKRIPQSG
jgi:hypothetical protein